MEAIDILLFCPDCGEQHIDKPQPETCELMQKDAERYRMLRMQDWDSAPLAVVRNLALAVKLGHDLPSRTRLDDAIDAEMQQKEGK